MASSWARSLTETVQDVLTNITEVAGADEEVVEEFGNDLGVMLVFLSGLFMAAFVICNILHIWHVSFIPESLVVVGLGAFAGWVLPTANSSVHHWGFAINLEEESIINELTLNLVLLPIIIFEAGWSLKHTDFTGQLPYILLFAIFGTLISTAVVGGLLLQTCGFHGICEPRVAFAYAALISAVDPVATLATYAHLNVEPLLNTLVFGESVINDAVAIVLFRTLNSPTSEEWQAMTESELTLEVFRGVILLLGGSVFLGIGLGCFYVLVLRLGRMRNSPALEILFILVCSFFTYGVAETVLKMSGIITTLFCSMVMSAYATPHLTIEGNVLASFLLKQMSSLADMVVFLFVGVTCVFLHKREDQKGYLAPWVMLFCLVGRMASVFPLAGIANGVKTAVGKQRRIAEEKWNLISWQQMIMMWHGGLRGGIALVLTLELGDWVDETNGVGSKTGLLNATVVCIAAFLLVFGGSTQCFLTMLGIPMGSEQDPLYLHRGKFIKCGEKFQSKVMLPLLVGDLREEMRHGMIGGILGKVLQEAEGRTHFPFLWGRRQLTG
eukprot:TRINITY_DN10893_c0_g1_i3.p1 TRINITY_DN10893_c0_g1~~TRINITY_DN10893_c0_g1_i3.p1  ORF type:complete len:554 (-),score=86.94 TRINITY_DN10893_c0_g1_i3:502-2163(-)